MTTIGRTFPKPVPEVFIDTGTDVIETVPEVGSEPVSEPAPEADPKPEKEGKAKKADTEKKS